MNIIIYRPFWVWINLFSLVLEKMLLMNTNVVVEVVWFNTI